MLFAGMTKCCKYKVLVQLLIALILMLLYLKLDSFESTAQADTDDDGANADDGGANADDDGANQGTGNVGTGMAGSIVGWESQPIQLSDSTRFLFSDPVGFMTVTSDGNSKLVSAETVSNFKDFDLVELRTGGTVSAYHEVMRDESDDKVLGVVGSAYERLVTGFTDVLIYPDVDECVVSGSGNVPFIPILIPSVQQFSKSELHIRNTSSVALRLVFRISDTVIPDVAYLELDTGHHIVINKRDDAWNL